MPLTLCFSEELPPLFGFHLSEPKSGSKVAPAG